MCANITANNTKHLWPQPFWWRASSTFSLYRQFCIILSYKETLITCSLRQLGIRKLQECGLTKAEYCVAHFARICGRNERSIFKVTVQAGHSAVHGSFKDWLERHCSVELAGKNCCHCLKCDGKNSNLGSMPGKLVDCRGSKGKRTSPVSCCSMHMWLGYDRDTGA